MKKTSGRTKRYYEKEGYYIQSVEKWIEATKQRLDLFHFADLLAFKEEDNNVFLIQSCGATGHSEHLRDLLANEIAQAWVQSKNRKLILISWRELAQRDKEGKLLKNKDGSRKKQKKWTPRIEEITKDYYKEF